MKVLITVGSKTSKNTLETKVKTFLYALQSLTSSFSNGQLKISRAKLKSQSKM